MSMDKDKMGRSKHGSGRNKGYSADPYSQGEDGFYKMMKQNGYRMKGNGIQQKGRAK